MMTTERGTLPFKAQTYGQSVNGRKLEIILPEQGSSPILIMGSIHGDESISTVLLSECLRQMGQEELQAAVILATNPDGVLNGTRCNANGVDLNRNFPTANWRPEPVAYRNHPDHPQNIKLSPGAHSGSEPETQALIQLIGELRPEMVISIHGFLDCVDDPLKTDLAQEISLRTGMPLVADVGYETPGSFGSWCAEEEIPIITYELPPDGLPALRVTHLPVLHDILTGALHPLLGS